MIEIYVDKKKMTPEDAKVIIETYAKYPTEFVNLMMVDELELEPFDPDEDGDEWKQGLVMMFSFWFFGAIPVIGFAIIDAIGGDDMEQVLISQHSRFAHALLTMSNATLTAVRAMHRASYLLLTA
jgi:DNA damage-binding protein 1